MRRCFLKYTKKKKRTLTFVTQMYHANNLVIVTLEYLLRCAYLFTPTTNDSRLVWVLILMYVFHLFLFLRF